MSRFFGLPLLALVLPSISFAESPAEKVARADAKETFADFDKSVDELISGKIESLREFQVKRFRLESGLQAYCDSLRGYESIYRQCAPKRESGSVRLNQAEIRLTRSQRKDRYAEAEDKIGSFVSRLRKLRNVQDDGKNISPDRLHEEVAKTLPEMRRYCKKIDVAAMAKECELAASRMDTSLSHYEEDLRSEVHGDLPEDPRIYTDTKPVLRCFVDLPRLHAPGATYRISDPLGRYRYEHMTKTRWGYAIDMDLSLFTETDVNHSISVRKTFQNPKNSKSYEVSFDPVFACVPDGASPPNCKASSINVGMYYLRPGAPETESNSSFPIKIDSTFNASISIDPAQEENFKVDCAVAAEIRKGGWVFSDSSFQEK